MASRPFPLPQDIAEKHARPAVYLFRCAAAYLRAGANRSGHLTPSGAARQLYGDGDRPTLKLIERAASVPATTTDSGWASQLAQQAIFDAAQPTSVSASATLIGRALHVDRRPCQVRQLAAPERVADLAGDGDHRLSGSART